MKKSMKRMTAGATMAVLLSASAVPAIADTYPALEVGSTDLTLVVNGQTIETNESIGQPFISTEDRTMIPLRLVNTALGYDTAWQEDGSIHITSADGSVDVTLTIGDTSFTANGESGDFGRPVAMLGDRTYLPARDFMELYGTVEWDSETRTVTVKTTAQPVEETTNWTFEIARSENEEVAYIKATNSIIGATATLYAPEEMPFYLEGYYVDENQIKVIDAVTYLGIGKYSVMGGFETRLYAVPDIYDGAERMLSYVGNVPCKSDYTVVNGYIYYTDGTELGPWEPSKTTLYFAKVGDTNTRVTFDLTFDVNACTLRVEDGVLIATEADGTRHEVLKVPGAGSVDVAHMKKVLEENATQEGFESSDDTLTFVEIACMPGASVSEEGGVD